MYFRQTTRVACKWYTHYSYTSNQGPSSQQGRQGLLKLPIPANTLSHCHVAATLLRRLVADGYCCTVLLMLPYCHSLLSSARQVCAAGWHWQDQCLHTQLNSVYICIHSQYSFYASWQTELRDIIYCDGILIGMHYMIYILPKWFVLQGVLIHIVYPRSKELLKVMFCLFFFRLRWLQHIQGRRSTRATNVLGALSSGALN